MKIDAAALGSAGRGRRVSRRFWRREEDIDRKLRALFSIYSVIDVWNRVRCGTVRTTENAEEFAYDALLGTDEDFTAFNYDPGADHDARILSFRDIASGG